MIRLLVGDGVKDCQSKTEVLGLSDWSNFAQKARHRVIVSKMLAIRS